METPKKKLAIISSYNESCGNASYTEALRREFSKYYEVDILGLQLDLLQSTNSHIKKLGDKHISDICSKLKNYDYVNIQFEAGLYGLTRTDIFNRVKKLIWASPNLIVTMHRVDVAKTLSDPGVLTSFLTVHFIRAIRNYRNSQFFQQLYQMVALEVKKKNRHSPANIIVHTKRDAKNIRLIFGVDNVYDFPLTFLPKNERLLERKSDNINIFRKKYGVDDNTVMVGVFGFVTKYKGHETVVDALKFLPKNYKAFFFGSQHPSSIAMNCQIDPYLDLLVKKIEKNKVDDRVIFAGNLSDEEFIEALYCCDITVLPYMEVNQSGSGIASLVLETGIPSIFSNNKAFAELNKYYPNCFERFDIGNYSELAYKITNYKTDAYRENLEKALEKYNIENNIAFHISIFEGKIGQNAD